MGRHIYTYINPTSKKDLEAAALALRNSGVIAYPTDVNWAFGVDPTSTSAVEKIRLLKPFHPKDQPFTLLCNSISMAAQYAYIEGYAYRTLKKLLPGPFTVLLASSKELPKLLKDKRKTVGIRIPDCPLLLDLITLIGTPLATTSVPSDVENPVVYGYQLDEKYGHQISVLLDLGNAVEPRETTIIDLTEPGELKVVRQGVGVL